MCDDITIKISRLRAGGPCLCSESFRAILQFIFNVYQPAGDENILITRSPFGYEAELVRYDNPVVKENEWIFTQEFDKITEWPIEKTFVIK